MHTNGWLGARRLCVPCDTALNEAASRRKDDTGRRPLAEDESLTALDTKPKVFQWQSSNWEPVILTLDRLIARLFELHQPQRPARQVECVAAAIGICTKHVRLSFVSLVCEKCIDAYSVVSRHRLNVGHFVNHFGGIRGGGFDRDDRTVRLENDTMDNAAREKPGGR